MTVGELINYLNQLPKDMEVVDASYDDIIEVKQAIWTHTNYPYTKPDKPVCMIL